MPRQLPIALSPTGSFLTHEKVSPGRPLGVLLLTGNKKQMPQILRGAVDLMFSPIRSTGLGVVLAGLSEFSPSLIYF